MGVTETLTGLYDSFIKGLPDPVPTFVTLLILTIIIAVYSVFIWKFYNFISTKNVLSLDLKKLNKLEHPVSAKILASLFYVLEYLIILPILIFFWFAFFTALLTVLSKELPANAIILISAMIIAAVRVTAYIPKYGESVSGEIAKIVPFTLLGISLTNPNFFKIDEIFLQFNKVLPLINDIWIYLFFIIALEFLLRIIFSIASIFRSKEKESETSENKIESKENQ